MKTPPREYAPAVCASGLGKLYGATVAVQEIDLVVQPGEVVAVLGPNGAGKTTTIEMLLGIRRPNAGQVRILGGRPDEAAVRARVGAMLQDSDAPDSLTVAEVIDLVGHYYPQALPVEYVLAAANLQAHRGHRVGQLSGGLRQRLSYALAIVGDPDLLFLDEPTAALDVAARAAFWAQVHEYASRGRTVLFSTHYLQEAQSNADRVVVINHGRVIQQGTPDQIRAVVAGTTVELRTDLPTAWFEAERTVRHLEAGVPGPAEDRDAGTRVLRIQTSEPEALLARVFASGAQVADLTVTRADLEAAFLHLTAEDADGAQTGSDADHDKHNENREKNDSENDDELTGVR